jgi:uncharacterized protein (TIGR00297 family)
VPFRFRCDFVAIPVRFRCDSVAIIHETLSFIVGFPPKELSLPKPRQSPAADLVALACAGALVAGFAAWRLPQPPLSRRQWLIAAAVTAVFAVLAWLARGVNWSGALAGSVIAFVLSAREIRMFYLLLAVFAVTLIATRLGTRRKQQLLAAESANGRSAGQVIANLGVAGAIAAFAPPGWTVLAIAALAEAAADTSSSEIGLAFSGRTVLITTWRPVAPGVDGGVSLHGTAAALAAAAVIALTARALGLIPAHQAAIVIYAGFLGALVDSLLGALLERPGLLNNDLVNLVGTGAAVVIAWLIA